MAGIAVAERARIGAENAAEKRHELVRSDAFAHRSVAGINADHHISGPAPIDTAAHCSLDSRNSEGKGRRRCKIPLPAKRQARRSPLASVASFAFVLAFRQRYTTEP
jgi:hypothetical protein